MDSPNHQRYKSKLFNLINRGSSQWRDRLIRSAQYLRVGVEWSVQILIYPLYLMVQAGRIIPKQLRQSFTQKALPTNKNKTVSSIPKVDQPLRKVLQETESCLSHSKTKNTTTKPNSNKKPVMVQGMASEMDSHNLVLVAENNTIIDIISETHQKHLKKYIRLETANYWYNFKQNNQYNSGLINTFSAKNNNVLPPIRWFWNVMGWMQTGTLAMNLDLFGESSLVPVVPKNNITALVIHSQFSPQETSTKSIQLSSSVTEKIEHLRKYIKEKSNQSLNIDNDDPFRIEFIIYAAIDYFFNRVIPHQQLTSNLPQQQLQLSTVSPKGFVSEKIDDPWLSEDDLYAEVSADNASSSVQFYPKFLSESDPLSREAKKSVKTRKTRRVNTLKTRKTVGKSVPNRQKNNHYQQSIIPKSQSSHSNYEIEKKSSHWIDTEAKTTGYVKHPLVRILEWLDSAIHWLEKLVHKLSKLWRNKH